MRLIDADTLKEKLKTDCSWELFDMLGNYKPDARAILDTIDSCPSAGPDKAVIDNLLFNINSSISPHASTTSVIAIKHCIQALYEEIYGEGARPKWMI